MFRIDHHAFRECWLHHQIDEYKFQIRDATVDFYMAEARLNRLWKQY